MKKTLSLAAVMTVISAPAFAANMENPLYMPHSREVYSKTTGGVMYKITDATLHQRLRDHDGEVEFPVWRASEEIGVGVTDRWMVHGVIGYTYDGDIDRQGFHLGRLGTTYRVIQTSDDIVWDLYGDLHMGGIQKMKGAYQGTATAGTFDYRNYSNGRWGVHVGSKVGKTWSRLTASVFAEVLKTWGNDNNEINVSELMLAPSMPVTAVGVPSKISAELKSTWEINAGANLFYQIDDRWSGGFGFRYNHHADNGVKSISTEIPTAMGRTVAAAFVDKLANMKDEFNEYISTITIARQMTDCLQLAWYLDYTFDDGHEKSSNSTNFKAETGLRLNLRF